jgi:hypothetical protein
MNVEKLVEWELAGETEALGKPEPQYRFVHHNSHIIWPGIEPEPPMWKAGDLQPELCMALTYKWYYTKLQFYGYVLRYVGHVFNIFKEHRKLMQNFTYKTSKDESRM